MGAYPLTDTSATYGWSGLDASGKRIFVPGPAPAAAKLTAVATYATKAAYAGAAETDRAAAAPIAVTQKARISAIDAACAAAIVGGFRSSALGSEHLYGSRPADQGNLDADMMAAASGGASVTAVIACSADGGATWAPVTHTAAQIGVAWTDFRAWRIACQARNRSLQAQIVAAPSAAAVAAIAWG